MAAIVQQVSGSITSSYGIATTFISSGTASALVAFVGLNYGTSGIYVTSPAVCVSDSAGNLWKQIAITPGGTAVAQNTRCAVWMTVNAQPVSWVSVGTTGFAAGAAWTIAEISGLPQAISIDYSLGTNAFGTAASLTGISTEADIGFAVISPASSGASVTTPAGWTALNSTASASNSVFPFWNTGVTAGTATVTAGITGAGTVPAYSYTLCTIAASASPPAQYDIRHPLNVIEAAFGATPGNPASSLDYTYSSEYISWEDISTRVTGGPVESRITTAAGRQYELQQEEAGEMNIFLDNHDGAFTPTNPGSPYYSNALNKNMSFQSGISPWTTRNSPTLSLSTAFTYASGLNAVSVQSLEVTPDGVHAFPSAESELVPVNANYPYTSSAWMYVPAGWASGAQVNIGWYDGTGTLISFATPTVFSAPAGQWFFMEQTSTPVSGAVFAAIFPQLVNTPASSTVFYVAEAALVAGSAPVVTGLVTLKTPIRVTSWWQGRQWPVWMGYAERWPQGWPELPQWGFSRATATDAISITAAGQMSSALIGEVLVDNPVAYLPCNEQYTSATVGATPSQPFFFGSSPFFAPADANGLIALNKASNNQVTGTYADGSSQQISTGLAINFFGDNGTGMGATGYSNGVTGQRGPSLIYTDPVLNTVVTSPGGSTFEFWFLFDGTSAEQVTLLTLYGNPSAFFAPGGTPNGAAVVIGVATGFTGGSILQITVQGATFSGSTPVLPSESPQYAVVTFNATGTSFTLWLNGVIELTESVTGSVSPLIAIVAGPGRYSYDCFSGVFSNLYEAFNYTAAHLAVYDYQLPATRIAAHYEAGAAGWSGVSAAYRFGQVLTWGQLGLKRGGYYTASAQGTAEITQIGPAYQLSGSPASDAINQIAQSEGGQYFVKPDGTLTYLERVSGYNQPVTAVFGDNATAAPDVLNSNPGFAFGKITGWTGQHGSVSYSSQMYGQYGSLLLNPSGTGTALAVSPAGAIVPGGTYVTGAWVYATAGGTVNVGLQWTGGSFAGTALVAPASWSFVSSSGTVPVSAAVTTASLTAGAGNGTANTLLISYGYFMQHSPEVPFMQETEFDFDDTYLYNEVAATQVDGPNQLITFDDRAITSQQEYFRRSALSVQSLAVSPYDVSDITTWDVGQFSQPVIHVSTIKLHASADPFVIFPVAFGIGIGDIVQVNRRPVGGAAITELGIVERVSCDIGSRYFYFSYQISPYQPANNVLCADTPGFDTPATTTLGW